MIQTVKNTIRILSILSFLRITKDKIQLIFKANNIYTINYYFKIKKLLSIVFNIYLIRLFS